MSTEFPEDFHLDLNKEPENPFDPIPPGTYTAQIIEASIDQFKTGRGYGLNVVWSIIGGEYDNRKVFQNIIITHDSPPALYRGQKMLQMLCRATGVTTSPRDVEVFLFKPVDLDVYIERATDTQFSDQNRVRAIRAPNDGGPRPPAAKPAPTAPKPRTAAGAAMPWARPKAVDVPF